MCDWRQGCWTAIESPHHAAAGRVNLIVPTPILQETVYVLETFYAGTPDTVAPKLMSLLSLTGVTCPDARWVLDGIQWYRTKNADFGDALLRAYAPLHHCEVKTFDKALIKNSAKSRPVSLHQESRPDRARHRER